MKERLEKHAWWEYIHEDLKDLIKQSFVLVNKAEGWEEKFKDYSFVIFSAAKAYEGFLKNVFRDMGLISDEEYFGKRFRIGKALNPHLEKDIREKESVYDRLVVFCQGKELPDILWQTWKEGRNLLFHWFPNQKNAISFEKSKAIFHKILIAMDLVYAKCISVRQ